MEPLKTFIVEDSQIILEGLIAALEEFGAVSVVGTAVDEPTAVAWLQQPDHACDLLIIDIFLKAGSGIGVLKTASGSSSVGKSVVLTNYATPDMRRTCSELGADRVFDKSGELEELMGYCARLANGDDTTAGELGPA